MSDLGSGHKWSSGVTVRPDGLFPAFYFWPLVEGISLVLLQAPSSIMFYHRLVRC